MFLVSPQLFYHNKHLIGTPLVFFRYWNVDFESVHFTRPHFTILHLRSHLCHVQVQEFGRSRVYFQVVFLALLNGCIYWMRFFRQIRRFICDSVDWHQYHRSIMGHHGRLEQTIYSYHQAFLSQSILLDRFTYCALHHLFLHSPQRTLQIVSIYFKLLYRQHFSNPDNLTEQA